MTREHEIHLSNISDNSETVKFATEIKADTASSSSKEKEETNKKLIAKVRFRIGNDNEMDRVL